MTDSIYWDAHHEADSEYRGAAVSSDSDVALLAYRGAAKRKGMLFWQGIEVESPAEIMGVHMSRDEPIWTRQFGGDWDFSEVVGDAFYQCMTVNVLGAVADVFCVGIRKGEDLWEILGLRASTGETVWVAEGTEPLPSHLDGKEGVLWFQALDGTLARVDVTSGQQTEVLKGGQDGVFAATDAGGCLHYSEEAATLTRVGIGGAVQWSASCSRSTVQALEEGVVVRGGRCVMVDATGIRGLDDDTGEENWAVQPEIFEGSDTATISGVGRFILLQVAGKQQVLFLDAEDGTVHTPIPEVEPLFWGSWGTEDALSCGKSGVWQLPAGESSIPRVLWKLEEEQRLIQWVNGENPVVLVLAGGSEDPSLHVGSFTSGEGLQTWMTLEQDAIPGMSAFPGGVILTTETGIQVVRP